MFDKKEKSRPKKEDVDQDELDWQKKQQEIAAKRLEEAPPGKVKCNCRKQIIDPTPKGKPCHYCGGLVG